MKKLLVAFSILTSLLLASCGGSCDKEECSKDKKECCSKEKEECCSKDKEKCEKECKEGDKKECCHKSEKKECAADCKKECCAKKDSTEVEVTPALESEVVEEAVDSTVAE